MNTTQIKDMLLRTHFKDPLEDALLSAIFDICDSHDQLEEQIQRARLVGGLRDTFAAAALTGIIACPETGVYRNPDGTICRSPEEVNAVLAARSYGYADAMLEERKKR